LNSEGSPPAAEGTASFAPWGVRGCLQRTNIAGLRCGAQQNLQFRFGIEADLLRCGNRRRR
jgi:hypothetical protein